MLTCSFLLTAFLCSPPAPSTQGPRGESADWPHIRGPQCDGRTTAAGLFGEDPVGLELKWRAALGPAYSGVAVSGKHLVTFFSDGTSDVVIALDALDGSESWRHVVGETYRGHDGSEDGPVSSPIIHGGVVYALGPLGDLVALNLEDGAAIWTKHLVKDFGSTAPDYGFTTTPIVADGVLVIQAGGDEGRSIAGLNPDTGEVLWSLGDDTTQYQSPVAMELAGRLQVIVPDGKRLLGLAPADGAILWEYTFPGERDSVRSNMATPIDGNRFAIGVNRTMSIVEVTGGETFEAKELRRCRDLGRGYTAPVAHDGHLYGLNNDFLTCVDIETGKRVWKSRPPGGSGLISIADRLLILGAEGVAVVARATPEGYEEEARLDVLEHTGYVWPSFANGRLYVRNSAEIASVAIVPSGAASALAAGSPVDAGSDGQAQGSGAFARFVASAEAAEDPQALVDAFMRDHSEFPMLEDGQMHVVFRGDVEDVAVAGTMIESGRPRAMKHIEGTDFYHHSFPIEAGTRWEYRFQVDYEDWKTDPLNPRTVPGEREDLHSEFVAPGYEVAKHFAEPEGEARGRIEEFEFTSVALGDTREIRVYLPHGYDEGDATYPVLVVHGGKDWIDKGLLTNTLDNLIGDSVAPTVAVFIQPARAWWTEGGGSGTEVYVGMLVGELLPELQERYRISSDAEERAVMGTQYFGVTAALAALLHPDSFGHVVIQSASLRDVARDVLFERLEAGPKADVDFHLTWNRYDDRNPDRAYDHGADSARLAEALKAAGYEVTGGEVLDSHGWGSLRARTDEFLKALFPADR